ncbi:hypothetical protein ACFL3R_01385 [Thermodesulfobacteriota bacterium]
MMKRVITILIILFSTITYAEDVSDLFKDGDKIEKSVIEKGKYYIYDWKKDRKGYVKEDFFDKDKMHIYDRNNNRIGTIKRNYFDKDKWEIKTDRGK